MWKGACMAAWTLVACAACPTGSGAAPSPVQQDSSPDITCDEQVRHVQPVLAGELRAHYVWKCLLEHEFEAFVRERRACSAATDCVEVPTYCPFGEGVSVARAYSDEVELKHRELLGKYSKTASCKYDSAPHGGPTCAAGYCIFLPWSAPAPNERPPPG